MQENKLMNLSILRTRNVGDYVCQPVRYFDFPQHEAELQDLRDPQSYADVIIYGGGGIGRRFQPGRAGGPVHAQHRSRIKIAWGVGTAIPGRGGHLPYAPDGFDLYGSREHKQAGAHYVPCASCMHPLFDQLRDTEPVLDVVLYYNYDPKRRRPDPGGPPAQHNEQPLHVALAHIASGAVVVTNSYHGAYWAQLLGRGVVIVDAFNTKFYGFEDQPRTLRSDSWRVSPADLRSAQPARPDALGHARELNRKFHERVLEVIGCE